MDKKLFALVQWISGEYRDTYTPGVPVEWIFDLDPKKFDPEDDESYVIEWRDGKRPKKGWKCYDAKVLQLSSK